MMSFRRYSGERLRDWETSIAICKLLDLVRSGGMSWLPIGGAARRVEGAALRYIGHCSMAVGMPHSAALEMASHWILASLRS